MNTTGQSFSEMYLKSLGDAKDDDVKAARSNFGRVADSLLDDTVNNANRIRTVDAALGVVSAKVDKMDSAFANYVQGNDKRVATAESEIHKIKNEWTLGQYVDRAASTFTITSAALSLAGLIGAAAATSKNNRLGNNQGGTNNG